MPKGPNESKWYATYVSTAEMPLGSSFTIFRKKAGPIFYCDGRAFRTVEAAYNFGKKNHRLKD